MAAAVGISTLVMCRWVFLGKRISFLVALLAGSLGHIDMIIERQLPPIRDKYQESRSEAVFSPLISHKTSSVGQVSAEPKAALPNNEGSCRYQDVDRPTSFSNLPHELLSVCTW